MEIRRWEHVLIMAPITVLPTCFPGSSLWELHVQVAEAGNASGGCPKSRLLLVRADLWLWECGTVGRVGVLEFIPHVHVQLQTNKLSLFRLHCGKHQIVPRDIETM